MTAPNTIPDEAAAQLAQTARYLQQDPDNPALLARAFDLAMQARAFDDAQFYVERALAAQPGDPYVLFRQAELLSARGQWQAAEPLYEGLLRDYPDPHIAAGLARCQARRGDHAASVETLWPYRLAPACPAAVAAQLLRSLHHAGRGNEALDYLAQAAGRFDADAGFCAAGSLVALDEGDAILAARLSKLAQAGGAAPLEALVVDGTVALGELDVDAAAAAFEAALAKAPNEARSLAGLGAVHIVRREFAQALPNLEAAHQGMPTHIGTLHLLAWCKLFMGDLEGAEHDFAQALEADRNFGDSHGGMAVVHAMRGERALAEREAAVALRLDPQSLSARYAQMVLSGDTSDPARFSRLAERILEGHHMGGGVTMAALLRRYRGT